jgi:hypothetical protein
LVLRRKGPSSIPFGNLLAAHDADPPHDVIGVRSNEYVSPFRRDFLIPDLKVVILLNMNVQVLTREPGLRASE